MKRSAPRVDDALVKQLATEASVDVRSVIRALAGLPVRGLAGARVAAALAELENPRTRAT